MSIGPFSIAQFFKTLAFRVSKLQISPKWPDVSRVGRLQRHSEACFVNDLLRDAADRLATSKSSAEEVERGAPSTESDPVEARELSAVDFFQWGSWWQRKFSQKKQECISTMDWMMDYAVMTVCDCYDSWTEGSFDEPLSHSQKGVGKMIADMDMHETLPKKSTRAVLWSHCQRSCRNKLFLDASGDFMQI